MINYFNKDCFEVLKSLPDKSIDHFFCDLPYNNQPHLKWDVECVIDLEELYKEFVRTSKGNSYIIHFCQQPFTTKIMTSSFRYNYCNHLIWDKNNITNPYGVNKSVGKCHEEILIFKIGNPKFTQQKDKSNIVMRKYNKVNLCANEHSYGKVYNYDDKKINWKLNNIAGLEGKVLGRSILKFSSKEIPKFNRHPTQKHLKLIEMILKLFTEEGQTIFDPTAGSGIFGEACFNTGRNYIGCELSEEYFKEFIQPRQERMNCFEGCFNEG